MIADLGAGRIRIPSASWHLDDDAHSRLPAAINRRLCPDYIMPCGYALDYSSQTPALRAKDLLMPCG